MLVAGSAAVGVIGTRHIGPSGPTLAGVDLVHPEGNKSTLNDASRLSETPIHKHILLKDDPKDVMLSLLRKELREASDMNRPVICSAARHIWEANRSHEPAMRSHLIRHGFNPETVTTQCMREHNGGMLFPHSILPAFPPK